MDELGKSISFSLTIYFIIMLLGYLIKLIKKYLMVMQTDIIRIYDREDILYKMDKVHTL
jgi:hypothetical protein